MYLRADGPDHHVLVLSGARTSPGSTTLRSRSRLPTTSTALNHVVLNTRNRAPLEQFYAGLLGFKLSDTLADFMTFWRCNANHHSLAFAAARGDHLGLNHAAFEVRDWADLMRGVLFS